MSEFDRCLSDWLAEDIPMQEEKLLALEVQVLLASHDLNTAFDNLILSLRYPHWIANALLQGDNAAPELEKK